MHLLDRTWRSPKRLRSQRFIGVGLGLGGVLLIIKILPLWIWPLGVGLWLVWSGLGPIVIGAGLIWAGWHLVSQR